MIKYRAEYLNKYTSSLCMRTFYVGQDICGLRNTRIEKLKEQSLEKEKEWWYTQLLPTLVPNGIIIDGECDD